MTDDADLLVDLPSPPAQGTDQDGVPILDCRQPTSERAAGRP